MSNWNKISLFKFQQIEAINNRQLLGDLDDLDKLLFSTCAVFDMTLYELDNMESKKAGKLIARAAKIFETPFKTKPYKRIGKYYLNYDPASMTFGQYVELSFFLQSTVKNAHFVMASISNTLWRKNQSEHHRKKSEYFLRQPVIKIIGSLEEFQKRFQAFEHEYRSLFGLSPEVHGQAAQTDKFNRRYGWIYAAEQVAQYERIRLEEAYALPVRQALNDLAYIKAKSKYEIELLKTQKL